MNVVNALHTALEKAGYRPHLDGGMLMAGCLWCVPASRGDGTAGVTVLGVHCGTSGCEANNDSLAIPRQLVKDGYLADAVLRELEPGPDRTSLISEDSEDANNEWAPIIPLNAPPPFPVDVLPPMPREWVTAISTFTQTPPDLAAMFALGAISATLAGKVSIEVKPGWVEPLCAYTAVVLPSGERKTPVVRAAAAPLVAWEQEAQKKDRTELSIQISKRKALEKQRDRAIEDLARATEDKARDKASADLTHATVELEENPPPVAKRLLVDDVTPEKLADLLTVHRRLAAISDEGGLFDILAGRYSDGPNLDAVLKAYDCAPFSVDRQGRDGGQVRNPALTLVFAVQPDVLQSLAEKRAMRGRGLLARFWYVMPTTRLGERLLDPPPVPEGITKAYGDRLGRLQSASSQSSQMPPGQVSEDCEEAKCTLSPEAKEELRGFRQRIEDRLKPETGDLYAASDWANKIPGGVVRIAGLLHFWENGEAGYGLRVSGETMAAAVQIGDYLIPHALAALRLAAPGGAALGPALAVLDWILKEPTRQTFSVRDAHQALRGSVLFREKASVEAALVQLAKFGYVRERPMPPPTGPGRRPSPVYEVNPVLRKEAA